MQVKTESKETRQSHGKGSVSPSNLNLQWLVQLGVQWCFVVQNFA